MNDSQPYDSLFYAYQREGALRSARRVAPIVSKTLGVKSVLDVGCGAGAWLCAHAENGVADLRGVDGDYVDRSLLLFDEARFTPADITQPLDLGAAFDLVQCLEVAEHIPRDRGPALIDNLTRHGEAVLFSAATPGQGGKGHINERSLDYWRGLFAERGYLAFDFLRPLIVGDTQVEWWYRYNTLLYVHALAVPCLPKTVRDAQCSIGVKIKDYSPATLKLRKLALQALPAGIVSRIAAIKHWYVTRSLSAG